MAYRQSTDAERQECLILTSNPGIGHQIANMIEWHWGQPQLVYDEDIAYSSVIKEKTAAIIADIDTDDLGGVALLAFCKHQQPCVATYAITSGNDELRKNMARDLGGCRGFFYLEDGNMRIDMTRGMAARLLIGKMPANREIILMAKDEDDGHN